MYIVLHITTDLRVGLKNVAGSRGRINQKNNRGRNNKKMLTVLRCTTLYYTVLFCTTVYYTILLLYTTQYYDVLHDATLYNTLLFCTIH